ncbi:HEAT repeat domain-containing protein [Pedobacter glucosidilyticus]|uniref:HEAT repeat domain-containing protein n=1 Tax=Pedobacter glucosidilyticus TaxID=1122941 RepID=UPI0026F2434A|nr:HEAT repeat domain-containing protein [Pedobacter glucosidilyticus]
MLLSVSVGEYLKNLFFDRLPFFPDNIRISLFIIMFCLIATLEIYLYVFLKKAKNKRDNYLNANWKEKISNMLSNIIIYGDEDDGLENVVNHFLPRFKKLPLKRKRVRNILIEEIRIYHSNFTGFTADVLKELFIKLELHKYTLEKLKSNYWEIQIEGIREIAQFWLYEYDQLVFALTDHEHEIVRMEAQTAHVRLNRDNPFKFLDNMRGRILPWHQLILFEIITKAKYVKIPSFVQWLGSPNDSVVIFCLKLIGYYQQLDALAEIVKLLKHPQEEIRKMSVWVIGKMEAEFVEEELLKIYPKETQKVKIEILSALGKISSGNYLSFLKDCLLTADFEIKMGATKAILGHGRKGKLMLQELQSIVPTKNQQIIAHVLDARI